MEFSVLQSFSPLDGLKVENLHALSRKAKLSELPSGRFLFKEGDIDRRTMYLVSGAIELLQDGRAIQVVRAGAPEARNPMAPAVPRRCSARVASDKVEFLSIDTETLDVMLTWDQTGAYEVGTIEAGFPSSDDWMTTLLQTKALHRIPAANIQAIFLRMERVHYAQGEIIIRQGDDGDYFFAIARGRCAVIRETPLNRAGIKLAELGMGDTFGEEALIADAQRNATVSAVTDSLLMRLSKDDFRKLLNEPMLRRVNYQIAQDIIAAGGQWLDVRLPSEFTNYHASQAINIPLFQVRSKMEMLRGDTEYVACCDTGRRSSAAAYILTEHGFNVSVLQGGLGATALAPGS